MVIKDFKRGKKLYPRYLQVQTLSLCNGRCIFCPYESLSGQLPQGKMTWELASYWHRRGISTEIQYINNRADTLDIDSLKPSKLGIKRRMNRMLFSYISGKRCWMPFSNMNILYKGDVILCCNDWGRKSILGNVNEKSLMDIWNGQEANRIRRHLLRKEYQAVEACRECSSARELF